MLKVIKYCLSIVAAAYFFLAGTGFNIVSYCCYSCEEKGIEFVAEHSCMAAHKHDANCKNDCCKSDIDISCNDLQHIFNGCHIFRASTETPVVSQASIDFDVPVLIQPVLFATCDLNIAQPVQNKVTPYTDPPIVIPSGRDVLCLKSVLLI